MSPLTRYLLETFLMLALVCVLAFFVLWGARKLGVVRNHGPLGLEGHLTLDARRAIYAVRVSDQVYVVGVSEAGMTKLGEMKRTDFQAGVLANPPPEPATFQSVLKRLKSQAPSQAAPPSNASETQGNDET
jgi:flagellar biogenesis protein FliO